MTKKTISNINGDKIRFLAEELLNEQKGASFPSGTEADPSRLHHELQVHHIELEMQNAELLRTRNELEKALEKYTDLYDFAPMGYFTLNRIGIINSVNLSGAGLVGVERSRLLGRQFCLFITDETRPVFRTFLEKVFSSSTKEACEVELLREGNVFLSVLIEALAVESGQECRIALIDVTDRKRGEETLRKVEETAENALRKMEETAEDALRKVEEAAGIPLQMEKAAEEARCKVEEASEAARLKVEEVTDSFRPEKDFPDAAFLKIERAAKIARQKVIKAADAVLLKVKGTVEVLHKEKELTEVLRHEKAMVEAATQAKGQFLANMSHELRTPMTGVLGMLELVLAGNLETEQRDFIRVAHTSALSLVRILNDILDLTKIEMGKLSIEEQPFSIRDCVESTLSILFPIAKIKKLDLNFTVSDDVPYVMIGDQTRISQILTNLAGNAVKFTEKGKVDLRVSIGGSTPDGKREVTFTVTDTGIGIPNDKKHLLFQSFSQLDDSHSRTFGGTGLGLAICREITERMNGTITFSSEEGKGCIFSCTIPLGEAESERYEVHTSLSKTTIEDTSCSEGFSKPFLLVAEDDPVIRQILGSMLQIVKFEVAFAENGQEVVEMWEHGKYDLILMDVQMPILNGFEATAAIREKERTCGGHIPIVAMTAHAGIKDEKKCLNSGMDAFISKPVNFAGTLQVIRENLTIDPGSGGTRGV